MLLSLVLTVCDGSVSKMTNRVTQLTWYEEWFLYLEFVYGKTICTVSSVSVLYCLSSRKAVNLIIDSKLKLVLEARKRWPQYATMAEDELLRNETWNSKYSDKRVVFWDNTGIDLHKPSGAELQRLTYSSYYAGNVAKGGIYV